MAHRRASLALAAIVVVARLVSGGGAAAAAATAEETIRAELALHHAPSRALRSAQGAHARFVARCSSLGASLAATPFVFEDPPRTLAPPPARPAATAVTAFPPPPSQARAPPS